ncbi:PcbC domain-containing protein [Histoplasma capsulatum var. duboisii H88]|uniref:PcbC domain-containing protein n=1 Tax=Ajellomyces capsulatus (strain H88) TaxID=544711 RepID=A0A8A1LS91_AJEC8|nr:PcbC domain-containing protein [Histoplasma capsulatum var. duboisii H88]
MWSGTGMVVVMTMTATMMTTTTVMLMVMMTGAPRTLTTAASPVSPPPCSSTKRQIRPLHSHRHQQQHLAASPNYRIPRTRRPGCTSARARDRSSR